MFSVVVFVGVLLLTERHHFFFFLLSLSGVFRCARPFLSFLSEMMIFCVSSLSFDLRIFFFMRARIRDFFFANKAPHKK